MILEFEHKHAPGGSDWRSEISQNEVRQPSGRMLAIGIVPSLAAVKACMWTGLSCFTPSGTQCSAIL